MALTTAADLLTLSSRSFLTDYTTNKNLFIAVGKIVYQTLLTFGGNPGPTPVDMEQPLEVALRSTSVFKTVCAAKLHANPVFYPIFARALARYMMDNDWGDIITP